MVDELARGLPDLAKHEGLGDHTIPLKAPRYEIEALQDKAGWLHSLLFKRLQIHTVPMLHFVHDMSVKTGAEMSQLIDAANATRAAD